MKFDDVRVGDSLDESQLLGDHLLLIFGYFVESDHLNCIFLHVGLLVGLKDFRRSAATDTAHKAILAYFFQGLCHNM